MDTSSSTQKPGFFNTLTTAYRMLNTSMIRAESVLDHSLGAVDDLALMAKNTTDMMVQEQRLENDAALKSLEAELAALDK